MITSMEKLHESGLDSDEIGEIIEKTHCKWCGIDLDESEEINGVCEGCRDAGEEFKC